MNIRIDNKLIVDLLAKKCEGREPQKERFIKFLDREEKKGLMQYHVEINPNFLKKNINSEEFFGQLNKFNKACNKAKRRKKIKEDPEFF